MVLPRPASGQAYVSLDSSMLASALYGSLTQGANLPAGSTLAQALDTLDGRGLLLSTDGGLTWHQSVVLTFDANGAGSQAWTATQQVLVKVENGAGVGLPAADLSGKDLHIAASLFTTLPGLRDVALAPIVIPVAEPGYAGPANNVDKVRSPRATDQPAIVVDPASGISYANFPDQAHDVSGIQGSLLIEGNDLDKPDYDGVLHQGIHLPSETDGTLAQRATGVPTPSATNDRVRVFDDGTTAGQAGMQSQARTLDGLSQVYGSPQAGDFDWLTGLGMTQGLDGAAGIITQTGHAGATHLYDQGVVFHGVESVNTMLGAGDDTYTVKHATVGTVTLVQGGGGNNLLVAQGDTVGGNGRPVLLFGSTSQDDSYYTATQGHRVAGQALDFGNTGNNTLDASGTSQGIILYGGAGSDTISGGSGNDLIAGGGGSNTIHAGQGDNIVFGNAGLNIDLGSPMDMGTGAPQVDQQSLADLTIVLTPAAAAQAAVGASADALAVGNNTIDALDGNNIVFANYGQIVTAAPVNYLRDRGDFIDAAAPGGTVRYLSGSGLLGLATIDLPSAGGVNTITVGSGRNALFGGMGDDVIRAQGLGGYNLIAADAVQATFNNLGHIALFQSFSPATGGDDRTYNNGAGVMIGGQGSDYLESGAGNNIIIGDNGMVAFIDDLPRQIAITDIGYGGDDTLWAGSGANIMIGGKGGDLFNGSLSKDVMIGDYAAITLDQSGRATNLTRFGPGGNMPDLITRAMEDMYTWHWEVSLPHYARGAGMGTAGIYGWASVNPLAVLGTSRDSQEKSVSMAPRQPDIMIGGRDDDISNTGSQAQGHDVVVPRNDPQGGDGGQSQDGGHAAQQHRHDAANRSKTTHRAKTADTVQEDADNTAQPASAAGASASTQAPDSAASSGAKASAEAVHEGGERAALAAGVALLGLSGALGAAREQGSTVVFNSRTNTWETKQKRKRGPTVGAAAPSEAEVLAQDE
jgi:Ca2+-binding RTX toxin-like protein